MNPQHQLLKELLLAFKLVCRQSRDAGAAAATNELLLPSQLLSSYCSVFMSGLKAGAGREGGGGFGSPGQSVVEWGGARKRGDEEILSVIG